ncbi:HD domain-containing protein [Aminipila butyrica]|uniref:HD domain-containing protein n=1 Tax=Aminipila butyrica TaxID=433296 RepID=A0A858BV91_9FIRM|nr:HD domain-containing phosphohydrolase [Aminipila butyrica]QIB69028.1 HD domain-containing protein [Aminipila butyrica]
MRISFNDILYAFSYALDCAEQELLGVTTHHGKRVAYLCVLLGKHLQLMENQLADLAACAILHDNAITEYIQAEYLNGIGMESEKSKSNKGVHCSLGEKNIKHLPLCSEAENAILYHHERADGSGPFGKTEGETPLFAQLIHLADNLDSNWDLGRMNQQKYQGLLQYLKENNGSLFSETCVTAFTEAVGYSELELLQQEDLEEILTGCLENTQRDYSEENLLDFAKMFARIIDYKSSFTSRHSMGIAERAAQMATYYGYDRMTVAKLFFAGAVHDIGKMVIDKDVLEKPGRLSNQEYKYVKNHAYYSYKILSRVRGLEDITRWAALHHETLNGKGYPFGLKAEELGFNERLMACLDIYQALTEERPYKPGFSHEKSMGILRNLVNIGNLDGTIVADLEKVYGGNPVKNS